MRGLSFYRHYPRPTDGTFLPRVRKLRQPKLVGDLDMLASRESLITLDAHAFNLLGAVVCGASRKQELSQGAI